MGGRKASKDASKSRSLQREQLALERERDEFNRQQIEEMNEYAREDRADLLSRRDRARELYDPLEQRQIGMQEGIYDLAEKGPDYDTATARSDADVAQSYGLQRAQERRRQQRYGINPAAGRASAMERRVGNAEALSRVYGRNRARQQEDDKDWSRRMAALGSGNYGNANYRTANASTNLGQLGVSGASGVLGQMSSSAGMNAAGAAAFSGKILADTLSGQFSTGGYGSYKPSSGGVDMDNFDYDIPDIKMSGGDLGGA